MKLISLDATSNTATLVGAHVNVLQFIFNRANNSEPTVLVLLVPGGPYISLTVLRWWHSLVEIQLKTADSWDLSSLNKRMISLDFNIAALLILSNEHLTQPESTYKYKHKNASDEYDNIKYGCN